MTTIKQKSISQIKPNIKELEKAFDGDLDLVLFFITWLKKGLVAKFAYQELHPDVTPESAEVGGSRMLSRVKRDYILAAYGLGPEKYFNQLKEGLEATKWNDFTGEREADHKTRKDYHDKLGKLLGIEQEGLGSLINSQGGPIQIIFKREVK